MIQCGKKTENSISTKCLDTKAIENVLCGEDEENGDSHINFSQHVNVDSTRLLPPTSIPGFDSDESLCQNTDVNNKERNVNVFQCNGDYDKHCFFMKKLCQSEDKSFISVHPKHVDIKTYTDCFKRDINKYFKRLEQVQQASSEFMVWGDPIPMGRVSGRSHHERSRHREERSREESRNCSGRTLLSQHGSRDSSNEEQSSRRRSSRKSNSKRKLRMHHHSDHGYNREQVLERVEERDNNSKSSDEEAVSIAKSGSKRARKMHGTTVFQSNPDYVYQDDDDFNMLSAKSGNQTTSPVAGGTKTTVNIFTALRTAKDMSSHEKLAETSVEVQSNLDDDLDDRKVEEEVVTHDVIRPTPITGKMKKRLIMSGTHVETLNRRMLDMSKQDEIVGEVVVMTVEKEECAACPICNEMFSMAEIEEHASECIKFVLPMGHP